MKKYTHEKGLKSIQKILDTTGGLKGVFYEDGYTYACNGYMIIRIRDQFPELPIMTSSMVNSVRQAWEICEKHLDDADYEYLAINRDPQKCVEYNEKGKKLSNLLRLMSREATVYVNPMYYKIAADCFPFMWTYIPKRRVAAVYVNGDDGFADGFILPILLFPGAIIEEVAPKSKKEEVA